MKRVVTPAEMDHLYSGPEGGSGKLGGMVCSFGSQLGLGRLGLLRSVVEPGKRAFPFHNHLGTEEAFVILEGEGTYRYGDGEHAVRAGDVCGAPKGGRDTAHQLVNTGDGPLVYIGISSSSDPDIVEYPDSDKFAAVAVAPGSDWFNAYFRTVRPAEGGVGYFDGETD